MLIKDLRDLEKTIKLARKLGVESMKVDNVEFHLGAIIPNKDNKYFKDLKEGLKSAITLESPDPLAHAKVPHYTPYVPVVATDIHTPDDLTDEQMLFYSSDVEPQS